MRPVRYKYLLQGAKPDRALHQKNFFLPFNCYNIAICPITLIDIFLQTIGILRYKILRLEVEKHQFILIIGQHVNKYIFEAQYSRKRP
jgi:hypothetical protein